MAEIEPNATTPYTREAAWQLVCEYTESPSLRKHALSVETCVRAYGEREADTLGLVGDERAAFIEKYAIAAVLHDFDYERFPSLDDHPFAGNKILAELGWPEEIRTAILSHASYSGVPRTVASRKGALRLRRTRRLPHRLLPGQAYKVNLRCRGGRSSQEDEGQGLRQRSSPRRHRERSSRARGRP